MENNFEKITCDQVIKDYNKLIDEYNKLIEEIIKKYDELKEENENLLKDMDMGKIFCEQKCDYSKYKSAIKVFNNLIEKKDNENDKLTNTVSDLNFANDELIKMIKYKNNQLKVFKDVIKDQKKENDRLKEENARLYEAYRIKVDKEQELFTIARTHLENNNKKTNNEKDDEKND